MPKVCLQAVEIVETDRDEEVGGIRRRDSRKPAPCVMRRPTRTSRTVGMSRTARLNASTSAARSSASRSVLRLHQDEMPDHGGLLGFLAFAFRRDGISGGRRLRRRGFLFGAASGCVVAPVDRAARAFAGRPDLAAQTTCARQRPCLEARTASGIRCSFRGARNLWDGVDPSARRRRRPLAVRLGARRMGAVRIGFDRFLKRSRGSRCAPPGRQSRPRFSSGGFGARCAACASAGDSQSRPRANHFITTSVFFRRSWCSVGRSSSRSRARKAVGCLIDEDGPVRVARRHPPIVTGIRDAFATRAARTAGGRPDTESPGPAECRRRRRSLRTRMRGSRRGGGPAPGTAAAPSA